jgi:hypothetical protein
MNSNLIVVADRGNLKAYRFVPSAQGRPPHLEIVETITLQEPKQNAREIYTDEAGAFPTQTGAGSRQNMQGNSMAERHLDLEETRRAVRELAQHITSLLGREKATSWAFAAPGEIQEAILRELPVAIRNLISEQLALDLVHVPAQQLLKHFSPRNAFSVH